MASTSSTIRIIFDGSVAGLRAAAEEARAAVQRVKAETDALSKVGDKVGAGFASFAKVATVLSSIGSAIPIIGGTVLALEQLLPVALLVPGAIAVIGAAYATWKIATAGFADAVKGDADALAALSPQARATAEAVRGLAPEFDKVKRSVQDKFFAGFADEVRQLGDIYLPILAKRLPEIASGFNAMGKAVAAALKGDRVGEAFGNILDNTAQALTRAKGAAGDFAAGIIQLASVGSNYLPDLGGFISFVAEQFRAFVETGLKNGSLKAFIDAALAGFHDLGLIIGDVGSIIGSVFTGLAGGVPVVDSVLTGLRDTTKALADFFAQASTQTALTALGDALRAVSAAVQDVLMAALIALAPIIVELAPVVAELARTFGEQLVNAIRIVGPVLLGLAQFLNDHKETVALVGAALLVLYGRFLLMKAATNGVAAIKALTAALGGLNAVLRLAGWAALGVIAVELDKINVAAAGGDPGKLTGLADTLHNIVEAGKALLAFDLGAIFADIGAEWDQLVSGFTEGTSPIGAFFKDMTAGVREWAGVVGGAIDSVIGFFTGLPDRANAALASFGTTVQTKLDEAGAWFDGLPARGEAALASLGTVIATKAGEIWTDFLADLGTGFEPVRAFFAQSPYEMGLAIGTGIGQLLAKGQELVEQLRVGAVTKFEEVRAWFASLPQQISDALAELGPFLLAKGNEAGTSFQTEVTRIFDEIVAWFTGLPARVGEALGLLPSTVATKATEAGTQAQTEVTTKFDAIVAFLLGIPGRAGAALGSLGAELLAKAQAAGESFKTGLQGKFDEAVQYCKDLPQKINDAIGDLSGLLVAAGKSAIGGLLQGIKDGYNEMITFVQGIADGIAANKGPLPYDRRVLRPAGLALMSGLLGGIKDGNADVQAFVATIAAGIGSSLDVSSIIRSATAAANGLSTSPTTPASAVPDLLRQLITSRDAPDVRVFIGDTELRGLVRTEVADRDRTTARIVRAGAGVA